MLRYAAVNGARRQEAAFRLQVSGGEQVVIRVFGPLDIETAPDLEARVLAVRPGARKVVVDLRQTDYLDSEGVKALFALQEQLDEQDGNFQILVRSGSRAERTILLLRLAGHFGLRQE
jgi:anti-anti-sigma factor